MSPAQRATLVASVIQRRGAAVTFGSTPVMAISDKVSSKEAGLEEILAEDLRAYVGACDPRVFNFAPASFVPTTSLAVPKTGDQIAWKGAPYTVSQAKLNDDDTLLDVFAFKSFLSASAGAIFPSGDVTRYTPGTVLTNLDGNLSALDATYGNASTILAYIDPSAAVFRPSIMGYEDQRTNRCFTLAALGQMDVIVDADGVPWVAETASQHYPITGDYRTMLMRLSAKPAGVA